VSYYSRVRHIMNQFATRDSTGILIFNIGARWMLVVNAALQSIYPGRDPIRIVQ
jgi:hypothetical protein